MNDMRLPVMRTVTLPGLLALDRDETITLTLRVDLPRRYFSTSCFVDTLTIKASQGLALRHAATQLVKRVVEEILNKEGL